MYKLYHLLFLFVLLIIPSYIDAMATEQMKVHFIDVGQGDSILIETPSEKTILIDGGPPEAGKRVVAYLKENKINTIDYMIATHPDIDHIGGLPKVMQSVSVNQIIDSGKLHTTKTYVKYISEIKRQAIPRTIAKVNEQINVDPLIKINVLNSYKKGRNNNQSSIVLKITYDKINFLFMGDVEKDQEKEMLKKGDLTAEIVKVAHHGSKTSSSFSFLKKVNPNVAFITYAKGNEFGHPVQNVIKNLIRLKAHIYSTATFGNIIIQTDGNSYFILPEKSPLDGISEKIA